MSGFNLSEWSIRNRSLIIFFMIGIIVAGTMAFLKLGRAEDPVFTIRTMVVQAQWPGATLDDTLQQVTERLERTLQEVSNLDRLRSYTNAGTTVIFVDLVGSAQGQAVADTWYDVRKKVADMRHTLPAGIVGPGFNDDFGDTFGIIYGFTAEGFTHRELRDYVEDVRSRLLLVPDVSKIEILGEQDERIFVDFSAETLAGLGVDPGGLIAALQAQNMVRPAGVLRTSEEALSLQVSGAFESEQDILDVNFMAGGRMLRLRDLAEIRRDYADPPQPLFRVNGEPALGLAIAMREGGDILGLGDNIAAEMASIVADLPIGINAQLVADQASTVDEAISDFTTSLWQAILIVLAVSFIALGVRAGTVVAIAIPLTLAIVFPVMDLIDIDLQRVSLGALIIALALLVDDALTTIDAMTRRLAAGDRMEVAAVYAYKTLAFAMLAGTLVTIAGFVPIGFAQSSAGEYTFSIFAVVGVALIASWLVAMIFAPLLGTMLLRAPKPDQNKEPGRVLRLYRRLLTTAIRARWLTIAVTLGLFVLSVLLLGLVPRQFFPPSDRVELLVDLRLPQNASIHATQSTVERFDKLLGEDPDIERWSSYVGRGAIRFYLPLNVQLANPFVGQSVIVTKSIEARERLQPRLEKLLAEEFPDVVSRVYPLELGPPVGWPLQYRVSGPDPAEVREIALRLAQVMATAPETRRINFDWMETARQLRIRIDQDEARRLGLEFGGHRHRAEHLDFRDHGYPGARRDLPDQRAGPGGARADPFHRNAAHPSSLAAGRADHPAEAVRDIRLRAGLSAGLAAQPGADADIAGRRGGRRPAGNRHRRAGPRDRGVVRDPAEGLPHRGWRHRGGKRREQRFGLRRRAADAVPRADRADVPAREFPAPVPGAERGAAGADRRRPGAAVLRSAAWVRRHPGHPRPCRHDRQKRGDPDRADRGGAEGRAHRDGRRGRGEQFPLPPDHADGGLHRARPHPHRVHCVLGFDGLRDHGRPAGRLAADARLPADAVRDVVRPPGEEPGGT